MRIDAECLNFLYMYRKHWNKITLYMETFLITNFVPKKVWFTNFLKVPLEKMFKVVIWGWAARLAPILKPVSIGGSDLMSQRDIGVCRSEFGGLE